MIDMNGHPLFFAELWNSCDVAEPIPLDDCESVKMYVMSGADAIASFRACSRCKIDQNQVEIWKRKLLSRLTTSFLIG